MHPRDLSDHVAYQAGRGIEEVARELGRDPDSLITLSSNENPLGPAPAAIAAVREAARTVNSYPKAVHTDLTAAIASSWGLPPESVWLANGGDGAIDYLSRAFLEPGDGVLVPEPGFVYYGMSARFHHGTVSRYPLRREDDFAITADELLEAYDGERVVYVTTPHNPTGASASLETVEQVAKKTEDDTLVVVDEAYAEFATTDTAITLVSERDDVAVLRTFSKAYGLAGLRLGYAVVPPAWGEAYARVNTPFAASEIACRAGLAALEDDDHLERSIRVAREGRERLRAGLETHVWPSQGNFVLVDVGDGSAVADALAQEGIIVRDCSSFGLPDCIRITAGPEDVMVRVAETLNDVLAGGGHR